MSLKSRADRLGLKGRLRELYTGACLAKGTCTEAGDHGVIAYRALFDRKLPWFWTRLWLRFASAVVQHLWAGCPQTNDQEHAERLAICRQCPHSTATTPPACKLCGCDLPWKARWREQQCPIKKWPELPLALPPLRRLWRSFFHSAKPR